MEFTQEKRAGVEWSKLGENRTLPNEGIRIHTLSFCLYHNLVSISGIAAFDVQKHKVGCLRDQHSDSSTDPHKLHSK